MLNFAHSRSAPSSTAPAWLAALAILAGCNKTPAQGAALDAGSTVTNGAHATTPTASSSGMQPTMVETLAALKPQPGDVWHVPDVVDFGSEFEGKQIVVDIVEPLSGQDVPTTTTDPYPLRVEAPELIGQSLNLVAPTFKPHDLARYMSRPRVTTPPMRAFGRLGRDRDLEYGSSKTWILYVDRTEKAVDAPAVATSMAEILRAPRMWDRRLVTLEGAFQSGFEVSNFEGAWLQLAPSLAKSNQGTFPKAGRLKITARVYARVGHRYGHLGAAAVQLEVSSFNQL